MNYPLLSNIFSYHYQLTSSVILFLCLLALTTEVYGQDAAINSLMHTCVSNDSNKSGKIVLYVPIARKCKAVVYEKFIITSYTEVDGLAIRPETIQPVTKTLVPFLQLHGNISYTFDYRSRLDTPFTAMNLQQHREQFYIDGVIKDKYPFRLIINARQSNSPFLKNRTDVNIVFNHRDFQQKIREKMITAIRDKAHGLDSLFNHYQSLKSEKLQSYASLQEWINDPARAEEIVQDRERLAREVINISHAENTIQGFDTLQDSKLKKLGNIVIDNNLKNGIHLPKEELLKQLNLRKDSVISRLKQDGATEKTIKQKKKEADSLYATINQLRKEADSVKKVMDKQITDLTARVRKAKSVNELQAIAKQEGLGTLNAADKALLSLTKFGIGRSAVNYSELTVNNISVTGINIEYNPSFYAAFAAGSVDYSFRDFALPRGHAPKQNLVLGRIGWGNKDKEIFILSAYSGTKNTFNASLADSTQIFPFGTNIHISGYSFEAIYKYNPNTEISFEAAKSTAPYSNPIERSKSSAGIFNFSDHSNEAMSVKARFAIPAIHASVQGFYRKVGAGFQSYSVFNTGTRQEGWGIKWRQSLFSNSLTLNMEIKKSLFDDPLLAYSYNSSMIFKSIQAVYRKRKWPVITMGYMPSTQLIKSASGYYSESIYYALNASIFYNYKLFKLPASTSMMYYRFYNKGTDSGFIFYNAQNFLLSHNLYGSKIKTQTDIQYNLQPLMHYWMAQQRVDVNLTHHLLVGAGIKDNFLLNNKMNYWGASLQASFDIREIGTIRLLYTKDHLPNGTGGFMPYDWGRASWIKVF